MAFQITVTHCKGQSPSVFIRDFADVNAATEYAFQQWPAAVKVDIQPVRVINLNQEGR